MVVNMNDESEEWSKNEFIGYLDVSLADLICSSKKNIYMADLLTTVPSGTNIDNSKAKSYEGLSNILIRIEEVEKVTHTLSIDIEGIDLDKKVYKTHTTKLIYILVNKNNRIRHNIKKIIIYVMKKKIPNNNRILLEKVIHLSLFQERKMMVLW